MQSAGSTLISHLREVAWNALYDAETIRLSISCCTELEWVSETELQGAIKKKFGPIKSTFPIVLTVSDVVQYESYTMRGSSEGGSFGFVKGEARFRLTDVAEGCELFYETEIKMGGKVAQIGSRLMSSALNKVINDFFTAFCAQIEERGGSPVDPE